MITADDLFARARATFRGVILFILFDTSHLELLPNTKYAFRFTPRHACSNRHSRLLMTISFRRALKLLAYD